MIKIIIITISIGICHCLDNGLALTPPMGWMHWQRYRCLIDCELFPDECISERLFRKTADYMVSEGYLDAGYQYIIIDDCWMSNKRDKDNRLQVNSTRFPNGIKALANYVHSKGLKLGIYADYGSLTCEGYPGSKDFLEIDAQTFAQWEVDYLKLDGCYADITEMEEGYSQMSQYLNKTGRPIVFSCSWPYYMEHHDIEPNYTAIAQSCNLWRSWDDVNDSWESVRKIFNWYGANQDRIASFAGPGNWNDPDMLVIGNYGLSHEQSKTQMTLWAILAAPLIMSVDLQNIKNDSKDILLNKDIIRINQDPLGKQGLLVLTINSADIWTRQINPLVGNSYTYAVAIVNRGHMGLPLRISFTPSLIGLNHTKGYRVMDIFAKQELLHTKTNGDIVVRVKPSGAVLLVLSPMK